MPRKRPVSLAKALLQYSGGLAVLFIVIGGLSRGYSPKMILALGISGAIFGAMSLPELAPGTIPFPAIWQVSLSVIGCLLFAFAVNAAALGYTIAIVVGIVLGLLAPRWLKHINFP
jgi:hypothetical protein